MSGATFAAGACFVMVIMLFVIADLYSTVNEQRRTIDAMRPYALTGYRRLRALAKAKAKKVAK